MADRPTVKEVADESTHIIKIIYDSKYGGQKTEMIDLPSDTSIERQSKLARILLDDFNIRLGFSRRGGCIPVKVVAAGRPYVAAYMYIFLEKDKSYISSIFSIKDSTVDQYFSDIISQRR
ncbi:hypothetical protein ACOZ4F_10910 [Haloarcula marismortui]|uniref:hypothetical protein n=1 Tax=Haloarcula marismortui TaxID=2238 RepID=UPI003C772A9A